KLMKNFDKPYHALTISEFWRRWHISLSTWFRDYVYIPMGGSRFGERRRFASLVVTFGISGLWHGANWTYVFWGLLNAIYLIVGSLSKGAQSHIWFDRHGRRNVAETLDHVGEHVPADVRWLGIVPRQHNGRRVVHIDSFRNRLGLRSHLDRAVSVAPDARR